MKMLDIFSGGKKQKFKCKECGNSFDSMSKLETCETSHKYLRGLVLDHIHEGSRCDIDWQRNIIRIMYPSAQDVATILAEKYVFYFNNDGYVYFKKKKTMRNEKHDRNWYNNRN